MFTVGQKVSHKTGLARIEEIVDKHIHGQAIRCYKLYLYQNQDIALFIPTVKAKEEIRSIVSRDEVSKFFDYLREASVPNNYGKGLKAWKRKLALLHDLSFWAWGSLYKQLKNKKKLTLNDKSILRDVVSLLAVEISFATGKMRDVIVDELEEAVFVTKEIVNGCNGSGSN